MKQAAQQENFEDDNEDDAQVASNVQTETPRRQEEECIRRRETDLLMRERDLMQREIDLLRRENEVLRTSPRSNASSVTSRATINIKNVGDLLNEYNGSGEDFERWRTQVNLLCNMYELDDNASKILVGSKLRGKALAWYRSRAEYLSMSLDKLFTEMEPMFNQPLGWLESRRRFESRKWQKSESFSDYCHNKVTLGNQVPIANDEFIDYIIDGIPSENLQNQARMNSFTAIPDLLKAFQRIRLPSSGTGIMKKEAPTDKSTRYKIYDKDYDAKVTGSKEATVGVKPIWRESIRCYKCEEQGHYAKDCPSKQTKQPSSKTSASEKIETKRADRQVGVVSNGDDNPAEESEEEDHNQDNRIYLVDLHEEVRDQFRKTITVTFSGKESFTCKSQLDTGCPVSLIKDSIVDRELLQAPENKWNYYHGINNSKLRVMGTVESQITLDDKSVIVRFGVVPDNTMSIPVLLGRDALKLFGYRLTKSPVYDQAISDILKVEVEIADLKNIHVNPEIAPARKATFDIIFSEHYCKPCRPPAPKVHSEAVITLNGNEIVQFNPRRLSYTDKEKVSEILSDLCQKGVIRESSSEYASPIVLARKQNGETRMCVDFRALNKIIARDNYPLPVMEDQLESLRGKQFFSTLDLKNGFYHISMSGDSIKYTSFITPLGQYEFVKMPFGLKIGPRRFQRFINTVMADLLRSNEVLVYMDDILVTSETLDDHFDTLKKVFDVLVQNKLELRLDKCFFLYTEIEYLGYKVSKAGLKPTDHGIEAVKNFPEPTTIKEVHSFVGLASYFRKFIKSFSLIAKPLYRLLKKTPLLFLKQKNEPPLKS